MPDGTCNMKFGACRPVRGVLATRRIAVYIGLGLAVGSLLILTALPQRQAALSPGDLASHHQTANGCQDCHAVGEGNLVDWVHAAFAARADSGQSDLCLKCHAEFGENAKYAHSLAPQSLVARTESIDQSQTRSPPLMLAVARRGRPTADQELACATCHEEHRGRDFDITQMGDLQCQVCHTQTFKSFGRGHPDFSSYPYTRRTQIHFNHQTHYQIHFANFKRGGQSDSGGNPQLWFDPDYG